MINTQNRLTAFREQLSIAKVDGFLLPREDEHLNEYVPPFAERLAWLSGFTGSAGMALILPHKAVVFSDGRYQVQMAQQLDDQLWSRQHMYETPSVAWLRAEDQNQLQSQGKNLRIGYDPKITAIELITPYLAAGLNMVPLPHNPVDAIWDDQPAPPTTDVIIHDLKWCGTPHQEKISTIAHDLRAAHRDAVVLIDPTSIAWLLNLRADDLPYLPVPLSFVIVTANAKTSLFIEESRISLQIREHLGEHVTIHAPDTLETALKALHDQHVALDFKKSPIWFKHTLENAGATVTNSTDPCLMPRARKNPTERKGMQHAHILDGIALTRFLYWLDTEGCGKTELQASAKLLAFRRMHPDCQGASFYSIAAAGEHAAIMHYAPTEKSDKTIEKNSFFLMDSGGQYPFGTTDVTRTIWIGDETPPAHFRDQYTRVLKGLIGLDQAIFPQGTMGYRLDPLARKALWAVGLDFDHGAGHGLGCNLSVHEWPLGFTRRPVLDPIFEGMILTNEPGYYAPGSHGIRLENAMETCPAPESRTGDFLCFKNITRAPIDRRAIELSLLNKTERDWINDYHARVEQEIAPHLSGNELTWLKDVCRPL